MTVMTKMTSHHGAWILIIAVVVMVFLRLDMVTAVDFHHDEKSSITSSSSSSHSSSSSSSSSRASFTSASSTHSACPDCDGCTTATTTTTTTIMTKPLEVFLLDGQSNMVGMGSLEHLKLLLDANETHDEYVHLWNLTSNMDWKEKEHTYIKFGNEVGLLKAGRGAAGPTRGGHIGPELEFGWVVGDSALKQRDDDNHDSSYEHSNDNEIDEACPCHNKKQPILLLKAAYGGRDLAIDFRPPLSGWTDAYPGVKPMHFGWEYRQMMEEIQDILANQLPSIVPNYNSTLGYHLAGMVWFQGWNDMLDWKKVNEYEYNLKNLIRSMRLDLDAPDMPVVIGELGMHGLHPEGRGADRVEAMRRAERNVTESDEFRNSTVFVPTAQYVIANETSYNGGFHYYGRADTYCHIGKAFGFAMLKLLNKTTTTKIEHPENIVPISVNGAKTFLHRLRGSWEVL